MWSMLMKQAFGQQGNFTGCTRQQPSYILTCLYTKNEDRGQYKATNPYCGIISVGLFMIAGVVILTW